MKLWSRRILIALLILIAAALVITQVVLWTDYPRRIVLSLVQRELGLRIEATSMSTGWLGGTTLHDVKLSLPLAKESFLDVPVLDIDHTALIPLAVTRKFELKRVEITRPAVVVQRDQAGRWNLQDVAELLAKAGGGTPQPGTKSRPPTLPKLRLIDGTIHVVEKNGQRAVITPLNVTGNPDGPLVYRYDLEAGPREGPRNDPRLKLVGEVAPGENWKHEVAIHAAPADWLTPWVPQPPTPLVVNARWAGVVNNGTLNGRLLIEEGKYKTFTANGRVLVQAGSANGAQQQLVLTPQDLVINTAVAAVPSVQLESGAIDVNGQTLRARQLRVSAVGGSAQVDGTADLAAMAAEFNAVWLDLAIGDGLQHSGNLAVSLRSPFPGGPQVSATLLTRGVTPQGRWNGDIRFDGGGRSFDDMLWTVRAQRLAWNAKVPLAVDNFTAKVAHRGQTLTLTEVDWPDHQVFAGGSVDLKSKQWSLRFNGQETGRATVSFIVDAHGDATRYQIDQFLCRADELELKADGVFNTQLPRPLDLRVYLTHTPGLVPRNGAPDTSTVRGRLFAEGNVSGLLNPMDLKLTGSLRTRDLVILGRTYGDIRGKIAGAVERSTANFDVSELAIFGGLLRVNGTWPYTGNDRLVESDPLRVRVTAQDLKLKEIGDLLKAPLEQGVAGGEWVIDVPIPRPQLGTIAVDGNFKAVDVAAAGGEFRADEVLGKTALRNGVLRAEPITLRRAEQNVTGTATVSVRANTAEPAKPTVQVATQTWPVKLSPTAIAAVTADANLAIDATEKVTAAGPITARASVATTQRAIGEATIDGNIDGRVATLEKITFDAAGGRAEGRGVVYADEPNRTTLALGWTGIAGDRLSDLVPQLQGLTGTFNGAVSLAPATAQRALEPLRLTIGITPDAAKYRAADVGPMKFSAFLNLAPNFALERIVLDAAPDEIRAAQAREAELDAQNVAINDRPLEWNDIRIADGRVRIWGRRGMHAATTGNRTTADNRAAAAAADSPDESGSAGARRAGEIQSHVIIEFARLDLDQIVHAVRPDADEMPARLSGSVTLHGDPSRPDLLLAQGNVRITESDLVKLDALALLYDAAGLGMQPKGPTGTGRLDLSLQNSAITLDNIYYFNRGVEAWSSGVRIGDVWQMPDSPIEGYVVGSARPLAALKLPFFSDADQILSVLQSNLTTVHISGSVADQQVRQATFGEVGTGLKQLMTGQVQGSRK